ncbi:c-type cytochrome [Pontibacter qinzhouensis]|uniref:C-type cytochrome n=1 Tax=Pontibacter qinzhouensis TaxID=2603253 RepID=A0A5C8K9W5_9BACT|nr:c-type cytochrome [Pontibacter qinzhouensis]TXK49372.1 c-type cytochrome [Pontibacter qinzhouensis]
MKKNLLLLSSLAFLLACGGNNNTNDYDQYYSRNGQQDSAAGAAVNAAARQSEVDTNLMNIGINRNAGAETPTPADNFEKGAKLISQSDCLACHKEKDKLVGPAYAEVAKKYEFNDKNVDYLAGKIKTGGKGVWGEIPMTPHPDLKDEDAKDMARYILSLR